MPDILTQNVAIELGLINGVNGIFRQLVYQLDSVSTDNLSEAYPSNMQYIYRPLYALIEIAGSKIEYNMEQLRPKLVPIPLIEQTFRVDISDILSKDKRPRSNQKEILSVKRRALPLVPAYCITTHKSQGKLWVKSSLIWNYLMKQTILPRFTYHYHVSKVWLIWLFCDILITRFCYSNRANPKLPRWNGWINCIWRLRFVLLTGFDVFSWLYKVVLNDVD